MKKNIFKVCTAGVLCFVSASVNAQFTSAPPVLNINSTYDDLRFNPSTGGAIRSLRGYTDNYLEIYANYTSNDGPALFLFTNRKASTGAAYNGYSDPGSIRMVGTGSNSAHTAFEVQNTPYGSGVTTELLRVKNSGDVEVHNNISAQNANIAGTVTTWNSQNYGDAFINGSLRLGDPTGGFYMPAGYSLYAKKGILTEKVKVAMYGDASNWADFVFDNDYDLKTLDEVETFIKKHKHLPEIPSTSEVHQEGLDLAQMDAKLLQKIEELTLYVIQQQKEIEVLKKKLK